MATATKDVRTIESEPVITLTVRYVVKSPFDYNGKHLKVGDAFIPMGGKFDAMIINQGKLVRRIEEAVDNAELARHSQ